MSTLPDHVERKLDRSTGCWLYTGALTDRGYARVKVRGKTVSLHRLSYMTIVGEIPTGLELDHLCRVRHCCNPAHLDPVTKQVNISRGLLGQRARETTHCPHGHAYDEKNTYFVKTGGRQCRACTNRRARDNQRRRRALGI